MLITKTAVILAGGKGSRLKQVVNDRPKPMALVRSKPFLYYLLEYWYQQGIRKFILLIGYDYMKIVDYFRDTYKEASVQYSVEEYPLGTGGALLKLVEDFNLEDRFVLLNGDSFIKITLEKLNFFYFAKNPDCILTLSSSFNTDRYMGCEIDKDERITGLNLKNKNNTKKNIFINSGVYLFTKHFFSGFRYKSFKNLSLENTILMNELKNKNIYGLYTKESLIDIGIPEDYKRIQNFHF